jgi:hypothetical protein
MWNTREQKEVHRTSWLENLQGRGHLGVQEKVGRVFCSVCSVIYETLQDTGLQINAYMIKVKFLFYTLLILVSSDLK